MKEKLTTRRFGSPLRYGLSMGGVALILASGGFALLFHILHRNPRDVLLFAFASACMTSVIALILGFISANNLRRRFAVAQFDNGGLQLYQKQGLTVVTYPLHELIWSHGYSIHDPDLIEGIALPCVIITWPPYSQVSRIAVGATASRRRRWISELEAFKVRRGPCRTRYSRMRRGLICAGAAVCTATSLAAGLWPFLQRQWLDRDNVLSAVSFMSCLAAYSAYLVCTVLQGDSVFLRRHSGRRVIDVVIWCVAIVKIGVVPQNSPVFAVTIALVGAIWIICIQMWILRSEVRRFGV